MSTSPPFITLGNKIKIFSLSDGTIGLDGGAMFGVVPRALWSRYYRPDEKNRIRLAINPLLIQTTDNNILVETGMGDRWDEKAREIFSIDRSNSLTQSLAALGLSAGDINIVINTHLHFDHAGGNTIKGATGEMEAAFPRARYIVQSGELRSAIEPNERTRASYRQDDFMAIKEGGLFDLPRTDVEVCKGVFSFRTSGHNNDIALVRIEGGGETALFLSDIIPTAAHINYPYIAAYDLSPLKTLQVKKDLIRRAAEEGWFLFFYHDPNVRCAKVGLDERGKPLLKKVF